MKRYLILLAALLCAVPSYAATKAQQIEFLLSQVRNSSGPLSGGTVTFYGAGTTTKKTVWLDRDKSIPAANPYTLDANGTAQLYAEGIYRVVVKNAQGGIVYDRDNLAFIAFSATETANSQTVGGYFPSTSATGNTVAVRDGNGKLPGDILGNSATVGTYSPSQSTTANTVVVRDGNGKIAGDILGNAATATSATSATTATSATSATTATNADKIDNFHASQTPTANQIPVLNSFGELMLGSKAVLSTQSPTSSVNFYGGNTYANLSSTNTTLVTVNAYTDIDNQWHYKINGAASMVNLQPSTLTFQTAASGTAGAVIPFGTSNAIYHTGNDSGLTHNDEANLKIIRGNIAGTGAITAGSGYTVTKNGTGDYTINFSSAFSGVPTTTATTFNGYSAVVVSTTASSVRIQTGNPSSGSLGMGLYDDAFGFITVGPR